MNSKNKSILGVIFLLTMGLVSCAPTMYYSTDIIDNSSDIKYSGPIVITKGGTYSGNWESKDPGTPAVLLQTSDPVIIENSNIRGRGSLVKGFGNRITLRNVNGYGLNPNVAGARVGWFLAAEEFFDIKIENCYGENTGGIYLRSYKGDSSKKESVFISKNKFKNINGLPSSGKDTYRLDLPDSIAHMIQFNDVNRIANAEISWNEVINEPEKSQVEENINMYMSSGTLDSPILIHDNYIQGAYSSQPELREKYSGGGIILGDGAKYYPSNIGYTRVYDNQIVSTTNQGIAIAGGVENHVYNNRIISSGKLPDGSRIPAQNTGVYLWNSSKDSSNARKNFSNNSITKNYIAWNKVTIDGISVGSPWWFPDCGQENNICDNNISDENVNLNTEKNEYLRWVDKLKSSKIKIGSSTQ